MIEFKNVSAGIGRDLVFSDLSFRLPNGKIYGVPASSSVSSLFLSLLASSSLPGSGSVRVNGFDTSSGLSSRLSVGFLPSSGVLFPDLTPVENFRFLFSARNIPSERSARKMKELFDLLGLEDSELSLPVRLFSPMDRLRLSILSVLVGDPEILLLDGVFSLLPPDDPDAFDSIVSLLLEISPSRTLFVSDPDASRLSRFCGELLIFSSPLPVSSVSVLPVSRPENDVTSCENASLTEETPDAGKEEN